MIERKVGFIGAGAMGGAFLKGMLDSGAADAGRLSASEPLAERRQALSERLGVSVLEDNRELVEQCDVVVLSVKPHVALAVASEIAPSIEPRHLIVSIVTGVTMGRLQDALGTDRLVRVVPNTPALVGAGASAYCASPGVSDEDVALVEQMLSAVGTCVRVEERLMDAVTGLSGSGPAYVYLAIEALGDGGVKMGLPRSVAIRLAAQTVLGAARMVLETGKHPCQLKDDVTTPGGTTVEGLHALEKGGVRRAFVDAVAAATEKARRLAEGS